MKLYIRSNIPYEYWFKDLSDFHGRREYEKEVKDYIDNIDNYYKHAVGVFLWGKNGTGKTLLAVTIIKAALEKKYNCFFVSYSEILSMFTSSWKSDSAKLAFEKNIENSDFLIIDDLGKENKSSLSESILDKTIRYRRSPTIITSNRNVEELKTDYSHRCGESLVSLIYGKMIHMHMLGSDFRKDISSKLKEIVKKGNYKTIK